MRFSPDHLSETALVEAAEPSACPAGVSGWGSSYEHHPGSRITKPCHVSPGLPIPMPRLGCRQPSGRTETDPGGPLALRKTSNMPAPGRRSASAAAWSCAPASRKLFSSQATPSGSSRATRAAGSRASSAATWSSRARLPQAVQQPGHALRVVEGDLGGGTLGQHGGLVPRARLPQAVQQPGHALRVAEGDVGGGTLGQRGGQVPARPPPAGCPAARPWLNGSPRVTWAAARSASTAAWSRAPAFPRLSSSKATSAGSSRATRAAGSRASSTATCPARPPPAGCPAARPRRSGRRG